MNTPIPCYCIASPLSNWRVLALGFVLLWASATGLGALDFVGEGEKQLSLNNPGKALTYLEAAAAQGPADERLLLNLGLAYQKTGQPAEARKAFRQGADLFGPARKIFLLNLGISSASTKDWSGADAAYTEALTDDPQFTDAMLNRANVRLNAQSWAEAAADYRSYQTAAPTNPQKDKIEQLLLLLDQAVVETEAARLAEETRQKKAQEAQEAAAASAAAEQEAAAAAAEAERQKQDEILARIRESLAGASVDSKALNTGQSGVKSDDGDFSLDP